MFGQDGYDLVLLLVVSLLVLLRRPDHQVANHELLCHNHPALSYKFPCDVPLRLRRIRRVHAICVGAGIIGAKAAVLACHSSGRLASASRNGDGSGFDFVSVRRLCAPFSFLLGPRSHPRCLVVRPLLLSSLEPR